MATPTRLLTADELLRLPDDHLRHELVDGTLATMSPPGFAHGLYGSRLQFALTSFVREHRLGVVPQGTGFVLRRDPETVRAPDVAFVSADRIPAGPLPETYFEGAPDLAVEVISPGERSRDVEAKVREYLACGARAVWVVRPRTRTVVTHHAGESPRTFTEHDTLEDRVVLPGFRYRVRELFEGIARK